VEGKGNSKAAKESGGGRPDADAQVAAPDAGRRGAQPSNRAPHNYVGSPCRVLRWAIDTLDLSYRGELSDRMLARLDGLKDLAQSENEAERAKAQLTIGDHLFAVAGHGRGRFRYVLTDERFFIQVSKGKTLPLVYAQVSSEYLTAAGVEAAANDLRYVVNSLGRVDGNERISRVDPCVDLVPSVPVDKWDVRQWVTRGRTKAAYWTAGDKFSGWRIAAGGAIQSRFYDKVLEVVEQSHKAYLFDLWVAQGWQAGQEVWRQEFQVGRAALKELRIGTVAELVRNLGALWAYLTRDWLRLAVASEDSNRSRWPDHSLWSVIASLDWSELPQPTLKRVRSSTAPRDEQIFTAFPGYIASLMAREGITDWSEGLGEALRQADVYHRLQGRSLARYVERKAKVKGRLLSTIDNAGKDELRIRAEAEAYRKAKDGE
jgi:hypothetical protein